MCGIVGYVGPGQAREKIIEGLKKLEYRGYDSAGVAVMDAGNIVLRKHTGDTANLEKIIENEKFNGNVGIGHTRWATHGVPSDVNAHPHMSRDGKIAIVHNGTIENYAQIRERLKKDYGIKFKSDTDSEVAAQLLAVNYKGDLHKALKETAANFRGSFVIAAVSSEEPDKIVATRRNAPLIAGEGSEGNFIASDVTALMKYAKDVYQLENDDTLVMCDEGIKIYDADGNPVTRQTMEITWDEETAEKEGYEHFMLKEIYEQPKVLSETLHKRLLHENEINLDGINLTKEDIDGFNKVYIVACGTAYHAGLVGKNMIEKLAKVPVEVDVASEFKYRDPYVDDKTLFIAVTQSGETLDTLEALREAKRKGARVLSVVNAVGSTVPRESDDVFYTWAGPEIAVASTKAYTTQLMCMYLIALYMGKTKGVLPQGEYEKILKELKQVPDKLEGFLADVEAIKKLGKKFSKKESMFFIGRGPDSGISYEASLKMKEISYINSFAIAAGELKHGTIALLDENSLVVCTATQDFLFEKVLSNIAEIKARGAKVIAVAKKGRTEIEGKADYTIYIPDCADEVTPLLSIVPLQLFAYYVAYNREGCNIDKPKNLAKAVTVE